MGRIGQRVHRGAPDFPVPLQAFLHCWENSNLDWEVGHLPTVLENPFFTVCLSGCSLPTLSELEQTAHPHARSLGRHFETNLPGSEMGWGRGNPTFES